VVARRALAWQHRRTLSFPSGILALSALCAVCTAMTGVALDEHEIEWAAIEADAMFLRAWVDSNATGVLALSAPRGFMMGAGETLSHFIVTEDACVEVESWWEDNVGESELSDFLLRAPSERALTAAVERFCAAWNALGVSPRSPR
jgi:hypothetical protein